MPHDFGQNPWNSFRGKGLTPLVLGALWVLAATATALLPMRHQMIPGRSLLIAGPILLVWIGVTHGWLWLALGCFAFVSMFRRPLRYYAQRLAARVAKPNP